MIIKRMDGDLAAMIRNNLKKPSLEKIYVAHGCNCHINQGRGIAKAFREFPAIYQADVDYGRKSDRNKLGEYSVANLRNRAIVSNLYTQFDYDPNKINIDYAALRKAFHNLNIAWYLQGRSEPLYIPLIGAGLAGGDWGIIENIINEETPDMDIIVIDYVENLDPRIV